MNARQQLIDEVLTRASAGKISMSESDARFAVEFTTLMGEIAWADDVLIAAERAAMVDALMNWTGLSHIPGAIDLIIDTCLEARHRHSPADEVAIAAAAFAETHGLGPAMLLLDCLFAVATAEGVIGPEEGAHLERIAAALRVDSALFRRFQDRWTPSLSRGDQVIPITGSRLRIGRGESMEIRIADPERR